MSDLNRKELFNSAYQAVQATVRETMEQLFMRNFTVSMTVSEEDNLAVTLAGEKFPAVAVTFSSAGQSANAEHLILLDADLALKLYSWMIGDEPEESVSDAHIEGLQEALTQIISQVQVLMDGEDSPVDVNEIKLVLRSDSAAVLENMPGDEGLQATYIVGVDDHNYHMNHYIWMEAAASTAAADGPSVSKADFESFMTSQGPGAEPESMELLLDVELEVVAELGKKIIPIKDLLKIGTGSVVELEKSAGEPLDLLINGRKFGEGEVVVVEDHFGIRITQLAGRKEKEKE